MRLRRSHCAGPGIHRIRRGRGFSYVDDNGESVLDSETLDRVRSLVIPPAWRDVWICPYPNGHIQAVGIDDAGRRQYLYHNAWRSARDEEKFDRALGLAVRLPRVRTRIDADLRRPGLGYARVLAGALRILDRGVFRTGGEEYAEENDSHGVATLLRGHVRLHAGQLRFRFPAKGGLERLAVIRDAELARLVTTLRRGRHDHERLFSYRDTSGERQEVTARDVNERFKEFAGEQYTVKDMRTWAATVLAAAEFATLDPPTSKAAEKRAEAHVMRAVAEQLGNTPAVARRAYVDPRVCQAYHAGHTIEATLRRLHTQHLAGDCGRASLERAVIRLLREQRR
ncbi:MAG: DNA topoisomerase IB [Kutzneria sp.]|nr:DNA topoisomerase IB [Kutzneria sp.]MBV9846583.1 DNA topoisomerase IB [Kutzneria sp.]